LLKRLYKFAIALVPEKLTDEQADLLRKTLFKLNCRIIIKNHAIFIGDKLPLANVGTNETPSHSTFVSSKTFPIEIQIPAE
jgi:hypothetical protein